MNITTIQKLVQKSFFGQPSNVTNRKPYSVSEPSSILNLRLPNGENYEERICIKDPIAGQLARILNELRRHGHKFMKKKYFHHALHPVDLLIIDEDQKFIPNDRPPGNWPTIVKCIMQQRKPTIYCWSFKFSERDHVSFPDVSNMKTHHRFFDNKESKSTQDNDETNQHNKLTNRSKDSIPSPSSRSVPNMSPDETDRPLVKPRNKSLVHQSNSIPELDMHSAPPIPPKTKPLSFGNLFEYYNDVTINDTPLKQNRDEIIPHDYFSANRGRITSHNISYNQPITPPYCSDKLWKQPSPKTPMIEYSPGNKGNNLPPRPPARDSSTAMPHARSSKKTIQSNSHSKMAPDKREITNNVSSPRTKHTPLQPTLTINYESQFTNEPSQAYKFKPLQTIKMPQPRNNAMRSSNSLYPLKYDTKYGEDRSSNEIVPPVPPKTSKSSSNICGPIAKPRKKQFDFEEPGKSSIAQAEIFVHDSLNCYPNNTYQTYQCLTTNFHNLPSSRTNFDSVQTFNQIDAPRIPPRQKINRRFENKLY